MRRWRRHPLIALLCALCLLGAQQVANAHVIGHVETVAKTATLDNSGDADLPAVDGICLTCAVFANLSSAAPAQAPALVATRAGDSRPPAPAAFFTPAPTAPPYASRAPPIVLP